MSGTFLFEALQKPLCSEEDEENRKLRAAAEELRQSIQIAEDLWEITDDADLIEAYSYRILSLKAQLRYTLKALRSGDIALCASFSGCAQPERVGESMG